MFNDEASNTALVRLASNPDFKRFMAEIAEERESVVDELMSTTNTVLVHQFQGKAQALVDIEQAVMSAPKLVESLRRNT